MGEWLETMFRQVKPVIAMAHLPALPGAPRYARSDGVEGLIRAVRADVEALVAGGVDGILFCNEDDRPYLFKAGAEQVAAMTRVVSDCAPPTLPFGVDFLWDAHAAIAIAHATGAGFVRGVFTGVYESDMGLWAPSAGDLLRFRDQIGAAHLRLFYNVVPEFASALGTRTIAQRARSAVVSSLADVLLVSGSMAGEQPPLASIVEAKRAVPEIPVLVNTGATAENVGEFLQVADGVIVGSSLKKDGYTWNRVDPERVRAFMDRVREVRRALQRTAQAP